MTGGTLAAPSSMPAPPPAPAARPSSAAIGAEEDEGLRVLFHSFDKDRDGALVESELSHLMAEMGLASSSADVAETLARLDDNQDGKVQFEEFKAHYMELEASRVAALRETAWYAALDTAAGEPAIMDSVWRAEGRVARAAHAESVRWAAARDEELARSEAGATAGMAGGSPSGVRELDPVLAASLLSGRAKLTELEDLVRHRGIWLFVSSTFLDTSIERDYWQAHVFPDCVKACADLGLEFDIVDLRWGVTDDLGDKHDTVDLCLSEIERCQRQSAGLSFLYLSGERYGWRALPKRVPVGEMDLLLKHVDRDAPVAAKVIKAWYYRDENIVADEPVYELRPMSVVKADAGVPREFVSFWGDAKKAGAQDVMAGALRAAARKAKLPKERLDEWNLSVTHKEVAKAIAMQKNTPGRARMVYRTLLGLHEAPAADAQANQHRQATGTEDRSLVDTLRSEVLASMDPAYVDRYQVTWPGATLSLDRPEDVQYVRQLSARLFAALVADAQAAAARMLPLPELQAEVASHALLAARRAEVFWGRESLRSDVARLAKPPTAPSRPKVVWGR